MLPSRWRGWRWDKLQSLAAWLDRGVRSRRQSLSLEWGLRAGMFGNLLAEIREDCAHFSVSAPQCQLKPLRQRQLKPPQHCERIISILAWAEARQQDVERRSTGLWRQGRALVSEQECELWLPSPTGGPPHRCGKRSPPSAVRLRRQFRLPLTRFLFYAQDARRFRVGDLVLGARRPNFGLCLDEEGGTGAVKLCQP